MHMCRSVLPLRLAKPEKTKGKGKGKGAAAKDDKGTEGKDAGKDAKGTTKADGKGGKKGDKQDEAPEVKKDPLARRALNFRPLSVMKDQKEVTELKDSDYPAWVWTLSDRLETIEELRALPVSQLTAKQFRRFRKLSFNLLAEAKRMDKRIQKKF